LLNYGDRFFLLRSAGSYEVGLYAFGYKVALAVGLFARGPLLMVWSSYMYPLARSADAAHVFGRAFTRMQAGYVFIGLGLCLFLDKAIALLGGSAYSQAAAIVPVIVLAYFFLGSADLMDGAFYLRRRTDLKTWVALASTVLMLALYALLIPLWGSSGAAWATVVGFAIHAALTRWVSQPLFAVHHEPGRIAAMLVLAASLWGLSLLLPASVWAMPAKLGLWALWPLGLWLGGLVRPEEKAWLRAAALQLLALFRAAFGSAPTNAPRLFQTATCREGEAPAEPLRRAAPVEGEAPAEPGSPVARQEPRPPIAAVEVIARQGDQGM
ncbi:MAG TPA: polysaccharide biosynthesis C-terminal domain-containing protein, partial [Gemmataceae bacterium]|nr:polysaccharide biosynthesis C-terminal domain-containing protein [Gemmataceae bacterium]